MPCHRDDFAASLKLCRELSSLNSATSTQVNSCTGRLMTHRVKEQLIYAFVNGNEGGNPSYVIATEDSASLADECVSIAVREKCEVTHLNFDNRSGSASVRFYVAAGPIAFCGHGTLAAASSASSIGRASTMLRLDFGEGTIDVLIDQRTGLIGYMEPAGRVDDVPLNQALLTQFRLAFRLPDLGEEQLSVSIGGSIRAKALIRFVLSDSLSCLAIDPERRDQLCTQLGVTGLYPFHVVDHGKVMARHFPIGSGHNEDMATGNIAATVAEFLMPSRNRSLEIMQGGKLCNVSRLVVGPTTHGWLVSGWCRTA